MEKRGYELAEYSWDESTGMAMLTWERTVSGIVEVEIVETPRPTRPEHVAFASTDHSVVFKHRSREDMIYDGLFLAVALAYG